MCGIAGLVRFSKLRPHERHAGRHMAATLGHRGPDGQGEYVDEFASLGHTRLSIIDVAGGAQPMSNEDGTIQVVFNGEIYNHASLADDLRARGHRLRSRCDTEVLVHLYEEYGECFVEHLRGMFAIAVWDKPRRRLVLVRDRLGIKPLYFAIEADRVTFGSEAKAILAVEEGPPLLDPRSLCDYLTFGHVPAPRSIYRGISKLEPGCLAICRPEGTTFHRYWDIPFTDQAPIRSEAEWLDLFADELEEAVAIRTIADVPLGAFLSGGVDSTAVVAAMCRRASGPILTHTIGFEQPDHDERKPARAAAMLLNSDHQELSGEIDALTSARLLTRFLDEPFADSSVIPTYHLSAATRKRVTVALSGDGGDELLAGYRRYRFDLAEMALRSLAPGWLRRATFGVAGWLYPQVDWLPQPLRAGTTLRNLACDDITAHLRSVSIRGGGISNLLRPEVRSAFGDYDPFAHGREIAERCPSRDPLNRLLYVDMKTTLADDILTKVDRASMAVGLEVRVPLLDHQLVSRACQMPSILKLAGNQDKYILRRIVERWTRQTIARRPKHGFEVPLQQWFRGELREPAHDLLLDRNARLHQWIEPRRIARLLAGHESGRQSNGRELWTLLTLELWARQWLATSANDRRNKQLAVSEPDVEPVCMNK